MATRIYVMWSIYLFNTFFRINKLTEKVNI